MTELSSLFNLREQSSRLALKQATLVAPNPTDRFWGLTQMMCKLEFTKESDP
jgi:hypothetical protein